MNNGRITLPVINTPAHRIDGHPSTFFDAGPKDHVFHSPNYSALRRLHPKHTQKESR